MRRWGKAGWIGNQRGNVVAMMMAMVAMMGVAGVAGMNMLSGPITTASKVTNQNMAQNDLLMNAKVVVMNAATRPNGGDEDGDGYIEPAPFIPTSEESCNITLPGEGGCLPMDIGAIQTDPWGTQYAYCVWDHGTETGSENRIAGEDSTSGAVIAIISAGPNKQFETPCLPYDGDPETNDIGINPDGLGDDLVQIYTYAGAVSGSGGLWELKQGEPTTAVIDKRLEIGDMSGGMGFAFDTVTGQGEFPYVKTDYLASRTGGTTPVTMDSNIALEGNYLSKDGTERGIFFDEHGGIKIRRGLANPSQTLPPSTAGSLSILEAGGMAEIYTGYVVAPATGLQSALAPTLTFAGRLSTGLAAWSGSTQFTYNVDGFVIAHDGGPTSGIFQGPRGFGLGTSGRQNDIFISGDGNVGIGGTGSPSSLLHVGRDEDSAQMIRVQNRSSGTAAQAALSLINDEGQYANFGLPGSAYVGGGGYAIGSSYWNTSAPAGMSLFSQSPSGTIRFYTAGNSTERMRISADGKIGIGTTEPELPLEVAGNIVTRFHGIFNHLAPVGRQFWALGTNNVSGHFFLGYRTDDAKTPGSLNAVPFWIEHGAPHNMVRISESGNVGIGTPTPQARLDVAGSGRFDGQLDMSSNRIINVATPTAAQDAATKAYVDSLGNRTCANGQVLKYVNGEWVCAADNSGGGADNLGNHIATTTLRGDTHDTHDLGTSAIRWRNGYFSSNVNVNGSTGYAVQGATTSTSHAGVLGQATASTGTASGVWGSSSGSTGSGVRGYASSGTGINYGGRFETISVSGRAVYGQASAATGTTYGGYFLNNSSSGYGVLAQAIATSGSTVGGYFSANNSPNGTGMLVYGGINGARIFSNAVSGTSYGVYAQVSSPDGYGIYSNGRMHSTGALTVGNSVTATAYYQSSDRHLKTEIERISDPFALLDGIEGKRFVWKDSNKPAYGVIAQDVEAVIPDAVGENKDGFKTVEYDQLIAPLIEAVKQLKAENDNLGRAMRELRADNDNLREEIRALTKGAH